MIFLRLPLLRLPTNHRNSLNLFSASISDYYSFPGENCRPINHCQKLIYFKNTVDRCLNYSTSNIRTFPISRRNFTSEIPNRKQQQPIVIGVNRKGSVLYSLSEEDKRNLSSVISRLKNPPTKTVEEDFDYYWPNLRFAPYLAARADAQTQREFVDFVDEWFRQFSTIYSSQEKACLKKLSRSKFDVSFKPTSQLFHLGKLNVRHGGRLAERLGRKPIEFFCNSMLDDVGEGFSKFADKGDLISALKGLVDLLIDARTGRKLYDDLPNPAWLNALNVYLNEKQPDDPNWFFSIREEAFTILILLKQLQINPQQHQPSDLFLTLCRLTKLGMEQSAAMLSKLSNQNEQNSPIQLSLLFAYADTWLLWNMDPDSLVTQSWHYWFVCVHYWLKSFKNIEIISAIEEEDYSKMPGDDDEEIFRGDNFNNDNQPDQKQRTHQLQYLNFVPQVASRFQKYDYFNRIFDDFRIAVEKTLSSTNDDNPAEEAKYLSRFIFNLGDVVAGLTDPAKIFRPQTKIGTEDRKKLLKNILSMHNLLENSWINIENEYLSYKSQARTLGGFQNFRFGFTRNPKELDTTNPAAPQPSDRYYEKFTEWCQKKRQEFYSEKSDNAGLRLVDNESSRRNQVANYVSAYLYKIQQIRPTKKPEKTLTELIRLFNISVNELDRNLYEQTMSAFFHIVTYFDIDPVLIEMENEKINNEKQIKQMWKAHFVRVEQALQDMKLGGQQKTDSHRAKECIRLLNSITTAVLKFDRFEEFRSISPLFQKRLRELLPTLHKWPAIHLSRRLNQLNDRVGSGNPIIDRSLITELIRQGTGFLD